MAVIAVPVPSSTFVKSHEKLKGSSLDTGLRVVRGGRRGWALSLLEYYLKPTPKWAMKMAAKNSAVPNRRKYRLSLQLHNMGKNQSTHIFRVRLIMKIIAIGN